MFDIIPWFDEVFIVEMGRIFFCGGDPDALFLSPGGAVGVPLYYIGPAIQECAFRLCGQIGVRLSPWIGLAVMWMGVRTWGRKAYPLRRFDVEMVALTFALSPLLFQSALLARVDAWSFAFAFISLAVLGPPESSRGFVRLVVGAFFTVLSVFTWPSALMIALLPPVFCFNRKRRREFLWFSLFAAMLVIVIAIPILPDLRIALESFSRHSSEAAPAATSLFCVVVEFMREFARAPFLMALSAVGLFAWIRCRRFMAVAAFVLALALGIATRLYAFRFLYLMPFFALMCVDAVVFLRCRAPRLIGGLLWTLVAYGVITGPLGHWFLRYPTLPDGLKQDLALAIGSGPKKVFSPDFATYYIGRELGWKQLMYTNPLIASDSEVVRDTLTRADAAVLRDWDPYETTQQSFTPFGLFCKYVLAKARREAALPVSQRSWAARVGICFLTSWHAPIVLDGFREVGRFGMIRAFVRDGKIRYGNKADE